MEWYIGCFRKYVDFEGRARRTEYWMFILINAIIGFALSFVDFLGAIYGLIAFLPGLAVMVRRLHDTNRSGWWILIGFIPLIGAIVLFIFTVLDSDPDYNDYGPNPKGYAA